MVNSRITVEDKHANRKDFLLISSFNQSNLLIFKKSSEVNLKKLF